ncbi:ferritin-like domain-containing protein [Arthrobacter sp. FW305-123]|nr:ferritin-like domain-containing protein [Arthrobacter sp. FW305-123]
MLVAVVALLVAGTGMVLIPRDSGTPPVLSFSEAARLEALEDALLLRESATTLVASAAPGAGTAGPGNTVTLLTTHAQALLDPHNDRTSSPSAAPAGSAHTVSATPGNRATFLAGLAGSGWKRLEDAREADGGIARLLAAVGSAQVLEAERLAALWTLPMPEKATAVGPKAPAATPSSASCPSVSPTPEPGSATTDTALAAVVRTQQEAIYVYQVALKRLDETKSAAAFKHLEGHELLLRQAESFTSANCADVPASVPGYRLPPQFSQDPAGFLGTVELASLPRFGDLVALSTEGTRSWAIENLLAAARRSLAWDAPLPALPGLVLEAGQLPPLPTPGSSKATTSTLPLGG